MDKIILELSDVTLELGGKKILDGLTEDSATDMIIEGLLSPEY